jgi:tetratricopeptide (TPR) repeat protein
MYGKLLKGFRAVPASADKMYRQTLGLCETVLGKEHPSTLTSMNNLATVLSDQGEYEEAIEMHRQALGLRETVLGKEHPSTVTSIYNLAYVFSNQQRFSEADALNCNPVSRPIVRGPKLSLPFAVINTRRRSVEIGF